MRNLLLCQYWSINFLIAFNLIICLCLFPFQFLSFHGLIKIVRESHCSPRFCNLNVDHSSIPFRARNDFKLSLMPDHCPQKGIPESCVKGKYPCLVISQSKCATSSVVCFGISQWCSEILTDVFVGCPCKEYRGKGEVPFFFFLRDN